VDSNRGASLSLFSNLTNAETSESSVTAFNTNGCTIGTNGSVNTNADTYVAWQWQAGQGTNTSNTSGSVTSTVSVNATAGFSIVTYTSQSSGTGTVGHGLGVAPQLILLKTRAVVGNWTVYHVSTGNTGYLQLNSNVSFTTSSGPWNNTSPTSSVFTLGTDWASSLSCVAYCWAPIAGFSQFGSYTGNGSADGPFIYTGFRPKFVMIKGSSGLANATGWDLFDTSRNPANVTNLYLLANTTQADGTDVYSYIDILSNGFKNRSIDTYGLNQSGATYIYAAFAENPFKYANAR
jgi:hypothetical protein